MEHLWQIQYSFLIPLLPLAGAVIAGFFGARWLKGNSHWPIWIGVGASAVISITLLFSMLALSNSAAHPQPAQLTFYSQASSVVSHQSLATSKSFYSWIKAGNFEASAGFFFDSLTAVILCVVTGIGFLI